MTAYSHRLTLHVEQDGHFVLLRDDELVEPVLHTGGAAVPEHRDATEEYIYVLEGSGRMVIDGKTYDGTKPNEYIQSFDIGLK